VFEEVRRVERGRVGVEGTVGGTEEHEEGGRSQTHYAVSGMDSGGRLRGSVRGRGVAMTKNDRNAKDCLGSLSIVMPSACGFGVVLF
jgi:hypothetical protein